MTICTKDREQYFGKVVNEKMVLNQLGQCATDDWYQINNHYPFVNPHDCVCMPNHIHGILIIGDHVRTQFLASSKQGTNPKRMHTNPSIAV